MKGFGSAGTSDGRASPDGFIRLIRAEIWMAHPRGPKEMKYEVSALIKRINRLYGPYTRETASSDNYTESQLGAFYPARYKYILNLVLV